MTRSPALLKMGPQEAVIREMEKDQLWESIQAMPDRERRVHTYAGTGWSTGAREPGRVGRRAQHEPRSGTQAPEQPGATAEEAIHAMAREVQDHPLLGLRKRLPGQRERPEPGVGVLMERGKGNEQNLPCSLQSLRGESEEIKEIYWERGEDMPQAQVTMDVRKVSDDVSVIDVKGELTAFAEGVLMDAYGQASDGKVRAIVLNFGGLEYTNSSGIGLLVTLLIRVNREKQRLLTYGLSEHYRNIFQITRLDAIGIYDSEEQAVQAADSL